MRFLRNFLLLIVPFVMLVSCKKEFQLNADWKDVTIVYGILNQLDSAHYIKITKAFLGPGNTLEYARIADSSNYPYPLDVTVEAWNSTSRVATYRFEPTIIPDKDSGQFYYPNQLVYVNDSVLNEDYTYKLVIRNPVTNQEVRSECTLVHDFTIKDPFAFQTVSYDPGKTRKLVWKPGVGGRLYQVIVRFFYQETSILDPTQTSEKYVDWIILPGRIVIPGEIGMEITESYSCDGFYSVLHARIPVNPDVVRAARILKYNFIVAADDLSTYIEVTRPSNSIIQEKPAYSNIENGIGLFSARFVKVVDSIQLSQRTKDELRTNPLTKDLGF